MSDFPDPTMSAEDLARTYSACYGRLEDGSLIRVSEIRDDARYAAFSITDSGAKQVDPPCSLFKIDFEIPEMGVLNIQTFRINSTVLVTKRVERQWKRGFTGKARIMALDNMMLRHTGKRYMPDPNSPAIAKALFDKVYPTFDEAIKMLMAHKAISVALNKKFSLHHELFSDKIMVRCYGKLIGHYDEGRKIIMIHPASVHFIEELLQYAPAEVIEL